MKVSVIINNHIYQMSRIEFKGLLKVVRESVKKGIIAIEKNGTVEMRNDKLANDFKLKEEIKEFKALGYKVYTA